MMTRHETNEIALMLQEAREQKALSEKRFQKALEGGNSDEAKRELLTVWFFHGRADAFEDILIMKE